LRLHYSWFFIFGLIAWALASSYFPDVFPDWSLATYWLIGLATSLLFFASLLLHEMAHSLVAKAAGIPIRSITLFIFGGVSQMAREPETPAVEFRVALAGPLTSLALSAIFWGIWAAARGFNEPLEAVAFWLGWINMVLAGFNLIPGFPLDGGRVLRSILWWRQRDLPRATRMASNVGRAVGYLFIFGGIWLLFAGLWFSGLWLAFVGWFLQSAAAGSYRQVAMQSILQGHTVSEVMTRDCPPIDPNLTVEQLIHDYILTSGRRCFPVVEAGSFLGIMAFQDVKDVSRDQRASTTVRDAMTPLDKLKLVGPNDELSGVLELLTTADVNQVPVIENGRIIGMVGRDAVLSFIQVRGELNE
jgi:Zn-dependent protease/predicted transcriptional regulator